MPSTRSAPFREEHQRVIQEALLERRRHRRASSSSHAAEVGSGPDQVMMTTSRVVPESQPEGRASLHVSFAGTMGTVMSPSHSEAGFQQGNNKRPQPSEVANDSFHLGSSWWGGGASSVRRAEEDAGSAGSFWIPSLLDHLQMHARMHHMTPLQPQEREDVLQRTVQRVLHREWFVRPGRLRRLGRRLMDEVVDARGAVTHAPAVRR